MSHTECRRVGVRVGGSFPPFYFPIFSQYTKGKLRPIQHYLYLLYKLAIQNVTTDDYMYMYYIGRYETSI